MTATSLAKADLHLHTTASDGTLAPRELVALAARKGLKVIAITDHDSVDGIPEALEAARSFSGLKVIPGVEVNTDSPQGEIHILGYFLRYRDPSLTGTLRQLRESRVTRAKQICQRLGELGMPIPWERVVAMAGRGSLGRPHIAKAMREMSYISTVKEAFDKYIGFGGPAYVEREKVTPEDAVRLIRSAGGIAALAHPLSLQELEAWIARLRASGLAGLEVRCPGYRPQDETYLEGLARKYGLVPLGGSDHHEFPDLYGAEIGDIAIPQQWLDRWLALEKGSS